MTLSNTRPAGSNSKVLYPSWPHPLCGGVLFNSAKLGLGIGGRVPTKACIRLAPTVGS